MILFVGFWYFEDLRGFVLVLLVDQVPLELIWLFFGVFLINFGLVTRESLKFIEELWIFLCLICFKFYASFILRNIDVFWLRIRSILKVSVGILRFRWLSFGLYLVCYDMYGSVGLHLRCMGSKSGSRILWVYLMKLLCEPLEYIILSPWEYL